jgi:hypothetical protein
MTDLTTIALSSIISHWRLAHHASHTPSAGITPGMTLFNEGLIAVIALLSSWIMAKIERRPFSGYGLAMEGWLLRLLAGLAWGLGFLSLLVLLLRATGLLAFDGRLLFGAAAARSGALWLLAFFAVGFFEEIFFRGYMQFTLARGLTAIYAFLGVSDRKSLGFWSAATLISFSFGFTHKSNPGESPIGILSAGLIGIVFCLSLWRTGSLWWAIGMHAAWDWAQSYLYGVGDSGLFVAGRLFATHPSGRPILSGGATGPEGSIFILPILLLVAIVILLTLPRSASGQPAIGSGPQLPALDLALGHEPTTSNPA